MAYKCRICGRYDVNSEGDICDLCELDQDPYFQDQSNYNNFQSHLQDSAQEDNQVHSHSRPQANRQPRARRQSRRVLLNNDTEVHNQERQDSRPTNRFAAAPVQASQVGQAPQQYTNNQANRVSSENVNQSRRQPLTSGITRNIFTDTERISGFVKWVNALFCGIPFALDDDVTTFQVFPDFLGSVNVNGNSCDQVLVYGKLNHGVISENNNIEVYGHRDRRNNVIARKIINVATGTTIKPARTISVAVVWLITVTVLGLLTAMIAGLGWIGVALCALVALCLTNFPLVTRIGGIIFRALGWLIRGLITVCVFIFHAVSETIKRFFDF